VTRISPKLRSVVAVTDHSSRSAAGNVANNLRALDARVAFVATVGKDPLPIRCGASCETKA